MEWLWIILRYLFPGDPIRQTAQAMRHRVQQLVHVMEDPDTLALLLVDPALRLQFEFLILDAEDSLRLWISMRGCQIARIRPKVPWSRAAPHLTHPRDLPELLARISALVADCDAMEQRAQAHATKLKQMRDANPLGIRPSGGPLRPASHATSPDFVGGGRRLSSLAKGGGGGATRSVVTEGAARSAATASKRAPPDSIDGATP